MTIIHQDKGGRTFPKMAEQTRKKLTPLAIRLRRARMNTYYKGAPISQALLGQVIGTTNTRISRWERGIAVPSEKFLLRLAKFLGMNDDQMWLDTYMIPPDIKVFLLTTNEGEKVIANIRTLLNMMNEEVGAYKKPTRKEIPENVMLRIEQSHIPKIERYYKQREANLLDQQKRTARTRWGDRKKEKV